MNLLIESLNRIDKNKLRSRKIWLIGRLEHVKEIIIWIRENGLDVAGILDNDKAKQGNKLENILIMAPEDALSPFDNTKLIIIYSPKYWLSMMEQFISMGYFENDQIIVIDKPSMEKNIFLAKAGVKKYQSLLKEYNQDVYIFLANCPLGDFYLLGLYFKEYIQRKKISNYAIIGTSDGVEKLSPMFGFTNIKIISEFDSEALIQAWKLMGNEKMNLMPLTIWQGAFNINSCLTRQHEGLTFMDTFKYMIYALPDSVKPCYPQYTPDKEKVIKIFKTEGLLPQKTVIISPFSYSIQMLSEHFWISLTESIRDKGYKVAVNVGNRSEANFILNTATIHLNFQDIMFAMEYAGTVIGIRSGFFDITSQAECKRIIIYPPKMQESVTWNRSDKEYCSLKSMKLCRDAYEIDITNNGEMINEISNLL